ncbi:MAG: DUF1697 domain-containing protein [Phycisphaerales bacterium]|nr:DUF1697 domain-containing protein [Phycisphaerae bacterium]NNM25447.1 DUF1697 domain-containing protein [Phycisphaerales bacterium]
MSSRFLALLRGINVGGHNIIKKDDLRACFEDLGFESVKTYIQSGNILFRSGSTSVKTLTGRVEEGLSDRFGYDAQTLVLSHRQYRTALEAAPAGWGEDDTKKHNALFTLRSTTPAKVIRMAPPPREGVDEISTGPGVIFWSISKKLVGRSSGTKFAASPVYRQVTVRNHNTVFKLLELFDQL